jgi:hypothetical protein
LDRTGRCSRRAEGDERTKFEQRRGGLCISPVGTICNTSNCVVPRHERGHEPEPATSLDDRDIGRAILGLQVADGEQQEGQIQREEEQEEGDCGLECADEQDEGEYEPALELTVRSGNGMEI